MTAPYLAQPVRSYSPFIDHSWRGDTILRCAMLKIRLLVPSACLHFRFICGLSILGVCLAACASSQTVGSLSQVKKIYVATLGQGKLGDEFRERVISRLRKDGSFGHGRTPVYLSVPRMRTFTHPDRKSPCKKNGPLRGHVSRGDEWWVNVRKGDTRCRSASQNGHSGSDAHRRE
jgi:hypothetical protein